MTQQHPITPPPQLVQQWLGEFFGFPLSCELSDSERFLATRAAQWGADQELEACCEWIHNETYDDCAAAFSGFIANLRAARRPKSPSLKRVALLQLDTLNVDLGLEGKGVDLSQIRRALEQLPDHE